MQFSYLGHACFLLETAGSRILIDPFISPNALVNNALKNDADGSLTAKLSVDLIDCDYVFLSHGHEDHVADAEAILRRTKAMLVSNFEIVSWFQAKGIEHVHPMNLGGSRSFDFGRIKYVQAVHSSVLPDGSYAGNPGGFVFESEGKTIYYAGDTALTYDMKLIGETYNLDWAILPIGDNFTMGPEDASKAADFVGCKRVIGMHYDTFGYIQINHEEAKKTFSANGKELHLMSIGDTKEL